MMRHSEQITGFIGMVEGFRDTAYQPIPGDKWTVGFGFTYVNGQPVQPGDTISKENAMDELDLQLEDLDNKLNRNKIPGNVTQNQYDAVVSLVYNIGLTNFLYNATGKLFYAGLSISDKFLLWNKSGGNVIAGLTNRRTKEKEIYDNAIYISQ